MNAVPAHRMRLMLTALALVFELAHLGWEHSHGGVLAHHLLNRADLPAISNWWGLLLIPALTWYLVGRMQRRISQGGANKRAVLAAFVGALAYGASLALAFTMGHEVVTYLFLGLIVAASLVPAYRAEYWRGTADTHRLRACDVLAHHALAVWGRMAAGTETSCQHLTITRGRERLFTDVVFGYSCKELPSLMRFTIGDGEKS